MSKNSNSYMTTLHFSQRDFPKKFMTEVPSNSDEKKTVHEQITET